MPAKIKFTEEQKNDILKQYQEGKTAKEISRVFHVSNCTILRILKNEFHIEMRKEPPKIGDIINGWEIIDIYHDLIKEPDNKKIAKIRNTSNGGDVIREIRLTNLTNGIIGRSDIYENGVIKRKDIAIKNTTHGKSKTRLYSIWHGMRNRCQNEVVKVVSGYGKLGISVCNEWNSFLIFEEWALSNGYAKNLSIDRIDLYGNYCPENCRWATNETQQRNRRNTLRLDFEAFGETKSIQEWANDNRCMVTYATLKRRILSKWDSQRALTEVRETKTKMNLRNWLKLKYRNIYEEYLTKYKYE